MYLYFTIVIKKTTTECPLLNDDFLKRRWLLFAVALYYMVVHTTYILSVCWLHFIIFLFHFIFRSFRVIRVESFIRLTHCFVRTINLSVSPLRQGSCCCLFFLQWNQSFYFLTVMQHCIRPRPQMQW